MKEEFRVKKSNKMSYFPELHPRSKKKKLNLCNYEKISNLKNPPDFDTLDFSETMN